jgi:hypothetical protein
MNIVCKNCSKEFRVPPSRVDLRKCCSHECSKKFLWEQAWYRKMQSESHRGNIPTNLEALIAQSRANHGYREKQIGKTAWNKGVSSVTDPRILVGSAHPEWKGGEVSYRNLHRWVERYLGKPNQCTNCGKCGSGKQIHWANKSQEYKRTLSDWLRLCAKCHKSYDMGKITIKV